MLLEILKHPTVKQKPTESNTKGGTSRRMSKRMGMTRWLEENISVLFSTYQKGDLPTIQDICDLLDSSFHEKIEKPFKNKENWSIATIDNLKGNTLPICLSRKGLPPCHPLLHDGRSQGRRCLQTTRLSDHHTCAAGGILGLLVLFVSGAAQGLRKGRKHGLGTSRSRSHWSYPWFQEKKSSTPSKSSILGVWMTGESPSCCIKLQKSTCWTFLLDGWSGNGYTMR